MKPIRRAMEWVFGVAGLLALLLWCCAGGLQQFFSGRSIASYGVGDGREVRVYSKGDPLDFDYYSVLYEVRDGGRVVHGPYWIGTDFDQHFDFKLVRSADGEVWGLYDAAGMQAEPILFHGPSGEVWPCPTEDTYSDPELWRKWKERYQRLRASSPDYPELDSFESAEHRTDRNR